MDRREDIWGFISDVHGNYAALEAALRVLEGARANRLAFLGDYLGRGDSNSDRCVRRIREVADLAVVGNRDLDWQERVAPTSKAWVLSLPRTACAGSILVSHGDPRLTPSLSTSQIARNFVRVWTEMERQHAQIWAFGHSHHARMWRSAGATGPVEVLAKDVVVSMEPDFRYYLNVGTTGLPFPGKGGPSVALVDMARRTIAQIALDQV